MKIDFGNQVLKHFTDWKQAISLFQEKGIDTINLIKKVFLETYLFSSALIIATEAKEENIYSKCNGSQEAYVWKRKNLLLYIFFLKEIGQVYKNRSSYSFTVDIYDVNILVSII